MNIRVTLLILLICCMLMLQSCATILGGPITNCQKYRPRYGAPRRVRWEAFFADLYCTWGLGLIVDFASGAMYRPCEHGYSQHMHYIEHIDPPHSHIEIKHVDAPK